LPVNPGGEGLLEGSKEYAPQLPHSEARFNGDSSPCPSTDEGCV
jgi:hypothetical protein